MASHKQRQARVIYEGSTDSFRIEIFDDQDRSWGLDTAYKCRNSADNPNAEEKMFISCTVLRKIAQLYELGYNVTFYT